MKTRERAIPFRGLRHEPQNEQGVVFLFGMIARELGYIVESIQTGFPDCIANRQVGTNTWEEVRIEFEFASINFRNQRHPVSGCDIIICWRHNWKDCPKSLDVVALSEIIEKLESLDFLVILYDKVEAKAMEPVNCQEIGKNLGFRYKDIENIVRYLEKEELISTESKVAGRANLIHLTDLGLKKAEEVKRKRA